MIKKYYYIFGYGSIIWENKDLEPIDIIDAKLIGAHRSFNKKSTVNRGTKEFPGLVLGLEYGGECQGKVFLISDKSFKILQTREGGYDEMYTPKNNIKIIDSNGELIADCIVFFPNISGKNYLNIDTSIEEKADIIKKGKKGTKSDAKEYLKEIKHFLNENNIQDDEVESLYKLVFDTIV